MAVEVALQHNDSYTENTYGFVNNINTPEGGTHITGFRNAITNTFNDYARKNKLLKDSEPNLSGDDIREGLTAIVSVKIENPQFEGQTKQKLGNSEARGAVDSVVSKQLEIFLEQNPAVAKLPLRNLFLHREPERQPERHVTLQEENPHWTVCHFLESLQTVLTRIRRTVRSIS